MKRLVRRPSKRSVAALAPSDLLFEIGTEELPAAYLPGLIEQLGREAEALLREQHLRFQQTHAFGTPRRLVLFVRGLAATQQKPAEDVRGPSKQVAYGPDGKPTQALLGFLRSQKGTLQQTKLVSSEKGEYVYLIRPASEMSTATVLTQLLPQLVGKLRAPKTMRWDASGLRFARPIRWLLAVYGARPVACRVGQLASRPQTWVGLPKTPRAAAVSSLDAYTHALKRGGILLDHQQRRSAIERMVARVARSAGGRPAPETVSHGLLEEVTYLVEQPVPLTGGFDPKYQALPREVLLASMAKYQRVFAIEADGAVLPTFVAILDGAPKRPEGVRRVIERILNARLADSLLFWAEDHTRLPLERMAEGLAGVTFHERLGSMAEKSKRLRALSEPLAEAWRATDEERQQLRKACQLAKADLVSAMVKEFPTLQGVVGKYYAKDSGESAAVATALEEQYLPSGERLPMSLIGSALAILDKFDTLTSYFALGIAPTGDQDPFGLRRAAQGIVEVAWKVHRPLPLAALFHTSSSLEPLRSAKPAESAGVVQRVQRYLFERLYSFAWPVPVSNDCIDAVLASAGDDLIDAMDRILILQQLAGHPGLLKAAKVIERTRNILRGAKLSQPQVDPARLKEAPEQQLWDVYRTNQSRLAGLTQQRAYAEATTLFGELFFEPLHRFFDQVLVNVPDEPLQQNRLALMKAIHTLYTERIADLSKLTLLQREETP